MLVSDFDGTITRLDIDWQALRERLGVRSVRQLWDGADGWSIVTEVETEAASRAAVRTAVVSLFDDEPALAVLTNNSEHAVAAFLERHPELCERVVAVVGRESLKAPKEDPEAFARGLRTCMAELAHTGAADELWYVGDQDYELELAQMHGARVTDARQVEPEAT